MCMYFSLISPWCSHTEDGDASECLPVKDKLEDQKCPNNRSLTVHDLNNNCLTSQTKSQNSSGEALFKTGDRKADSEKQCEGQMRHKDQNENQEKHQKENQNLSQNDVLKKKIEIQQDEIDNSVVSEEKKNDQSNRKSGEGGTLFGNRNVKDTLEKFRCDSREKMKSNSDSGRFGSEKQSNKKSKALKESAKEGKESFSFESRDKCSKTLKLANVKDDRSSGLLRSSEAQNRKREKTSKEEHSTLKYKDESENEGHPKHTNKKAKRKHEDKESDGDPEEPSMSFESYLNYDVDVFKRKERSGVKKPPKKIKTSVKDPDMKACKSPAMSNNVTSAKQVCLTMILKVKLFECR